MWDKETMAPGSTLRVKRSPTTPAVHNGSVYVIPPATPITGKARQPHLDEQSSQDLDELIFALKTGAGYSPSEISHPLDREVETTEAGGNQYEMRRISIADTHL